MELEYFSAVAADDLDTIKKILESCPFKPDIVMSNDINIAINYNKFDIDEFDNCFKDYFEISCETAIHVACRFGSLNVLEYLWDLEIDLGNHEHLLDIALQNGHLNIISFLIDKVEPNLEKEKSIFRKCVEYGFMDIAKFLIDRCNIDINAINGFEAPILCLASRPNNIDMFNLLLDSGANVNYSDNEEYTDNDEYTDNEEYTETPLDECIRNENIEGIKQMIRCGLDVNAKCGYFKNGIFAAVFTAVYKKNIEILELLLANCCPNLEMVDGNGNTVLHNMINGNGNAVLRIMVGVEGDYEKKVVKLLLKYGANLNNI